MARQIEKNFSILDLKKEEKFIEDQAQEGFILTRVADGTYSFQEGKAFKASCVIEYYKEDQGPKGFYEAQGLKLVYSYKGKIGHWSYYLGPYKENLERRKDDRKDLYQTLKRRNEIFWTIIPLSLLLFSIYMVYTSKNYYFFLLTLAAGLLLNKSRLINKELKEDED